MSDVFRIRPAAFVAGIAATVLFLLALGSVGVSRAAAETAAPLAPPVCPFYVPDCLNKIPDDTCDPQVDPNCVPPPPPNPTDPGPPPIPIPCTSPSNPNCHIWPEPIPQTEDCVMHHVNPSVTCSPVHVGVTGKQVGPVATPTVDIYEPLP